MGKKGFVQKRFFQRKQQNQKIRHDIICCIWFEIDFKTICHRFWKFYECVTKIVQNSYFLFFKKVAHKKLGAQKFLNLKENMICLGLFSVIVKATGEIKLHLHASEKHPKCLQDFLQGLQSTRLEKLPKCPQGARIARFVPSLQGVQNCKPCKAWKCLQGTMLHDCTAVKGFLKIVRLQGTRLQVYKRARLHGPKQRFAKITVLMWTQCASPCTTKVEKYIMWLQGLQMGNFLKSLREDMNMNCGRKYFVTFLINNEEF